MEMSRAIFLRNKQNDIALKLNQLKRIMMPSSVVVFNNRMLAYVSVWSTMKFYTFSKCSGWRFKCCQCRLKCTQEQRFQPTLSVGVLSLLNVKP